MVWMQKGCAAFGNSKVLGKMKRTTLIITTVLLAITAVAFEEISVVSLGDIKSVTFPEDEENKPILLVSTGLDFDSEYNSTRAQRGKENLNTYSQQDLRPQLWRKRRERRQIQSPQYAGPLTSDLSAAQHCHGLYLRWKRPASPISPDQPYTSSEFKHYNIYRSSQYFTSVQGMVPYASGKEHYELRRLDVVSWMDKDPVTNSLVWYAVTIVTRDNKEFKDVTPAKAMFIGAFGPANARVPLTPSSLKFKTKNHASMYNSHRNEYFVAWDVDTNTDYKPDRVYCVRLTESGTVLGNEIMDTTANLPSGVQGWPSVTYNPVTNEYLVSFQASTPRYFGGKPFIIGQRINANSLTRAANPSVLLKGDGGISVINPKIIFNKLTSGYLLLAEAINAQAKHVMFLVCIDSQGNNVKLSQIFGVGPRSGRIFYDTKRNEILIVSLIPKNAIDKQGDVVPKLAYSIIVTKRNASCGQLQATSRNLLAGETNLLNPSISGFYDAARDRLMLFWSDIVNGKRIVKSSRIIIAAGGHGVEFMDKHEEHVCPSSVSVQQPFAAPLPSSTGQILVWEQYISGRLKIGSNLAKEESFQFEGRYQSKPVIATNEKRGQVLVTWKEVINARQVNLFARVLKPVTHRCTSCAAPKVCKRENVCVRPHKANNPCSVSNGGCNQICLRSYEGAKCSCRGGFQLSADKKNCVSAGKQPVEYTIIVATFNSIWKTALLADGSWKFDRLPFNGKSIVALYVDQKRDTLYWSDVDLSVIWKSKMDGTKSTIFMSNVRADGVVVDSERGKVFWTDFLNKKVEMANIDQTSRTVLASGGIEKPRALTMCRIGSVTYIYWTDWGSPAKIERLQLDPSLNTVLNRRVIVSSGLGWPNGLTAECNKNLLFWADAQIDRIEVSDLMGNRRRVLTGAKVVHPYSLAIFGDSIYWTDWEGSLLRADKATGLNKKEILSTLERPTGLYIMKGKVQTTKSCPDPGLPQNGRRNGNEFTEDSILTFSCNKNFDIFGESQIRCQSNGQWTDRVPICIETRCPDPPIPYNGNRVVTGSLVGDGVVYTCNPGYKIIGSNVRRCQSNGEWDGRQPSCFGLPVFLDEPANQTLSIGKAAVLKCKASGDGRVKHSWLKDGLPFKPKDIGTRIFIFSSSVFIQSVRYSDSGSFTCVVSNEAGKLTSTAHLRILGKKIPECGIAKFTRSQRIAGGRIVTSGTHPWMAMLWGRKVGGVFCGGSLIAEKWVLTAAHCFDGKFGIRDTEVKFGKVRSHRKESHQQIRRIKNLFKHPRYSDDTFDSDLALIELDSPVIITDYVIPICLPYEDSDFDLLKVGAEALITGWGSRDKAREADGKRSKRLRQVTIPVVDQSLCQTKMKYQVTANMFCAGDGDKGDSCKGDSGGPLMIYNSKTKKQVVVGIVSWGEKCGQKDAFGVYVRLYNFLDWVNSSIQKAG